MLLTITTTHQPATDLGYLLHKDPAKAQSFELAFGVAHVFYPEASDERCTAALLLDIDPVGLVRRPKSSGGEMPMLRQYVNDRPYVASSFLSTAVSKVYGTALGGRSRGRQELADSAIPLEAHIAAIPCAAGEELLRGLFEPLGYEVTVEAHALDPAYPEWGDSRYYSLTISANVRLADLLSHLSVLVPVLDNEKHYWVGSDEVDKLLRRGGEWLQRHPRREQIATRYLRHRRRFVREALARLVEADGSAPDEDDPAVEAPTEPEEVIERPLGLHDQRLGSVMAALRAAGARRVLDLGCGEGRLLELLAREPGIDEALGIDVSFREVEEARDNLTRLPERRRAAIRAEHGSLVYRDARLSGWDAAVLLEVIEHIEPGRLPAVERNVFQFAAPATVVVTTPNVEYNQRFPTLPAGQKRHHDHRFEWTRAQFQEWAET
ncbi:MAG: 3' terminal RNA ribose 2'-O-methyltransferase Hen1, partial [Tepidiformaceae bacterium]